MLDRDRARALSERVLALSQADQAEVWLSESETTHLRFARNAPSTSGATSNHSLTVRSAFGARSGAATGNQLDDESLAEVVHRSEELARLVPEDPEFVPALGAQSYTEVDAFDETTALRAPARVADGVARCLGDATALDLVAAGFTTASAEIACVANSKGLFGYHESTRAFAAETVRTRDGAGSGWAAQASHRIRDIDYGAISSRAIGKAIASAKPRPAQPLRPGRYVAILEAACVANLVQHMVSRMPARPADEGRSYFSAEGGGNRIGQKLFRDDVDIYSDPAHPLAPALPWGDDGLPQRRRAWIEGGRVANLVYDRYWASKQGAEPVPSPTNLVMGGGDGRVEDLIRSTERGVLVTSLWYIRDVDPRTLLLTGLTRDGVFWIENGEIAHPLTNYRWNDSPISVLKDIQAMAAPVRVPPRPSQSANVIVPALKTRFTLSSISEAV